MSEQQQPSQGAGWLPPHDDEHPSPPAWTDGHCFAATWRDVLAFARGALAATADAKWRHLRLDDGWDPDPDPDTDADVEQAIAAKLHVCLRLTRVLAVCEHTAIDPALIEALPDWPDDDAGWGYGPDARLPATPLFFDFESEAGVPAAWSEPSWPLEFHLRGAVCWEHDRLLSVVPIGSVGGRNLFGGTDYEPWVRLVFAPASDSYPPPGPGDVVIRADDSFDVWVDIRGESACAHRVSIALNLGLRVLRLLWLIDSTDAELVQPVLPRAERRRAARAGKRISSVIEGLPSIELHAEQANDDDVTFECPCPLPRTHERFEQAHALWHEAVDAYHDETAFLRKLNPLIESLRTTTMVLQKEIKPLGEDLADWYSTWQQRMRDDPKMKWVKDQRDEIVHEGHIEKHSKARVRIAGHQLSGPTTEIDVEPWQTADEIARQLRVSGLSREARHDGVLIVERRWTVEPFEDDELLDVLAHCFGVLTEILSEAHVRLDGDMSDCEANDDAVHPIDVDLSHRTGRPLCMWVERERRTSVRDLESGAPVRVHEHASRTTPERLEAAAKRYGLVPSGLPAAGASPHDIAESLHQQARHVFDVDGYHDAIAWIIRDGKIVDQVGVQAGSRRERYLIFDRLGARAGHLGADAVVLTSETWQAALLEPDDPDAGFSASQRTDRGEALVTHVVAIDPPRVDSWSSVIVRDADVATLGELERAPTLAQPVFESLMRAWQMARDTPR